MELDRVVQIRTRRAGHERAAFGTAYLVAPRLALTAAHLLGDADGPWDSARIGVRLTEAAPAEHRARVRWFRLDDVVDAALLDIEHGEDGATTPAWTPPGSFQDGKDPHPQRWGRCVTAKPVQVMALGFPRVQRGPAGRAAEQLSARIPPLTGGATRRYELLSNEPLPGAATRSGGPSPWSGMSGAAVFSDRLLLGVVRADRQAEGGGSRLTATRIQDLLADEAFRTAVRNASSIMPQLEAVELAPLLHPAPPERDLRSPSMLLRADAEAVAFHGREKELAELLDWCAPEGGRRLEVRVLTGPAGQGKTRLARELMERTRARGWVAGQLLREPPDRPGDTVSPGFEVLRDVQSPHHLLLVIDYAETQPRLIHRVLEQLQQSRRRARVLLLSRSVGTWLTEAHGAGHHGHELLATAKEIKLTALSDSQDARERAVDAAVRGFSRMLAQMPESGAVDWRAAAAAVLPPGPPGPGHDSALTVQMDVLTALLQHGPAPLEDAEQPLPLLLRHEERYWKSTASGLPLGAGAHGDGGRLSLLRDAVAVATLCGAAHEEEALTTVLALPTLAAAGTEGAGIAAELSHWLRRLYPAPDGQFWGQLQPDRLAEYQAARRVLENERLLPALFARVSQAQRVRTLDVLARSAVLHANAGRGGEAGAVLRRLEEVLDAASVPAPVLRAHSDALPQTSHVLSHYALRIAEDLHRACQFVNQPLSALNDPVARGDRAWAWQNLALRCRGAGRWERAYKAASAALALRRASAGEDRPVPLEARADLARSWLELARCALALGHLDEALDAVNTAHGLLDALTTWANGDAFERDRAEAVRLQSIVLWHLDRLEESDRLAGEALGLSRRLVSRRPDLHAALHARNLRDHALSFWRMGQYEAARAQDEEAVTTLRALTRGNPDAHTADLAVCLLSLAVDLANLHRYEESADLEREAIGLLRPLADDLPEVHGPDLAQLLHNLAWDLQTLGRPSDALPSLREAVEVRRRLTERRPDVFLPQLGSSLGTLGYLYEVLDHMDVAVDHYEQALSAYERAARTLTRADRADQVRAAENLGWALEKLDRAKDAIRVQRDAVRICRQLAGENPERFTLTLARALNRYGNLYGAIEKNVTQRILLREALDLTRRTDSRTDLALCLYDLGLSYEGDNLPSHAIPLLEEGRDLYEQLVRSDPETHRAMLAEICSRLASAALRISDWPQAVRATERAVAVRRPLLRADRAAQETELLGDLFQLAMARSRAGHRAAAWRTALEAEEVFRSLAGWTDRSAATRAGLLRRQARMFLVCARGRPYRDNVRALAPAREAVRLARQAAEENWPEGAADLRKALKVLTDVHIRLGRPVEATTAWHRSAV
ncbi:tetratricopeptide repeat-containing serine protease family protein [Streptomyces plicatus]|uniref:Tetratricopeptide repeat protein n=1 Tax=Streptomyces plicatus TaxID=1922 RepID=A0ABW1XRJ2_STRPL|nr:tetratricopeptide repeat-containing serine protease family protein [Streptomyces plicatus]GGZ89077.1 hypothetical protein GCM10010301_71620 [Streptomyces plicatus]